tara:strand:+ start:284 stop:886 length:603 start_codon:yes stop_codon:yes gene_type:complete
VNEYDKIHKYLLKKSEKITEIHNLIKSNGVLLIEKDEISFFDFLVKTIISQQISSKAAKSIWKKVIIMSKSYNLEIKELFNKKNSEKIFAKVGISAQKFGYLKHIHNEISNKRLSEENLKNLEFIKFKKILQSYKGIGDWTCHMVGIFYFGNINIWPKSDLIIKKFIKKVNNDTHKLIDLEKEFSPFLSILAIHIWKHFD